MWSSCELRTARSGSLREYFDPVRAAKALDTPILGQISAEHISYMTSRIPLGRIGEPDEVAALICWLASEDMTFSTGACFDISGGRAVY